MSALPAHDEPDMCTASLAFPAQSVLSTPVQFIDAMLLTFT